MKSRKTFDRLLAVCAAVALAAGTLVSVPAPAAQAAFEVAGAGQLPMAGNLNLHDPTIYKQGDTYYAAATHRGLFSAPTLNGPWTGIGSVSAAPWTSIAGNSLWAPHVKLIGDTYYYYYSISGFGSNNSAIGLKTTKTPGIPSSYIDHGSSIVRSGTLDPGGATFNAIDPSIEQDANGNWWLLWGSHFDGIFTQQLAADMVTLVGAMYEVADRSSEDFPVTNPSFNRIEGPSVIKFGDWYYLFAAWDWCCRGNGADNTYKIVVGRSQTINGPFLDKNGIDLAEGGGTIILNSRQAAPGVTPAGLWRAPGAPDFLMDNGVMYMSYHTYNPGTTMGIRPVNWDDGWPFFQEDGGGFYDIEPGAYYKLNMQAGVITDPNSLQNPTASNDCLAASGSNVVREACETGDVDQSWRLERYGEGFYGWRSMTGDQTSCLAMANLSGTIGTDVGLALCDRTDTQQWYFDDTGHGFHRITGKDSNLAVEVANANGVVQTEVIGGYPRNGDHSTGNLTQAAKWPPQQWRFELTSGSVDEATTTTLALSSSSINPWESATAAVTVAAADGSGTPSGDVEIVVDGVVHGTVDLANGTASYPITGLTPGAHQVAARFLGTELWAPTLTSLWLPSASDAAIVEVLRVLNVTASASVRCIAGKAHVYLSIANADLSAVNLTAASAYGTKTFVAIAAGKSAVHSFTTRLSNVVGETVNIEATGSIDGQPVTTQLTASYNATRCG